MEVDLVDLGFVGGDRHFLLLFCLLLAVICINLLLIFLLNFLFHGGPPSFGKEGLDFICKFLEVVRKSCHCAFENLLTLTSSKD